MGNQIVVLQIAFLACLSHKIGDGLIAFHALIQLMIARRTEIGTHKITVRGDFRVIHVELHIIVVARFVIGTTALGIKHGKIGVDLTRFLYRVQQTLEIFQRST